MSAELALKFLRRCFVSSAGFGLLRQSTITSSIVVCFLFCSTCLGQGTFYIYNMGQGLNARVSDSRTGAGLEGNAWLGQLYFSLGLGASESSLVPALPPATFASGAAAGYFDTQFDLIRILPGVEPGTAFTAQLRAWNAAAGATYEEAAASPIVLSESQFWFPVQRIFLASLQVHSPQLCPLFRSAAYGTVDNCSVHVWAFYFVSTTPSIRPSTAS
jgi:hypothetical protein